MAPAEPLGEAPSKAAASPSRDRVTTRGLHTFPMGITPGESSDGMHLRETIDGRNDGTTSSSRRYAQRSASTRDSSMVVIDISFAACLLGAPVSRVRQGVVAATPLPLRCSSPLSKVPSPIPHKPHPHSPNGQIFGVTRRAPSPLLHYMPLISGRL